METFINNIIATAVTIIISFLIYFFIKQVINRILASGIKKAKHRKSVTIIKVITDPDQKHFIRKLISQIVAAILVFLLPTIVNIIMAWLPDGGLNVSSCWQKARETKGEIGIILPVDNLER